MTKTIQPCSWKSVVYAKTENNMGSLLTLFNNLNDLYKNISRLNYIIKDYASQTEKLEQILYTMKTKE